MEEKRLPSTFPGNLFSIQFELEQVTRTRVRSPVVTKNSTRAMWENGGQLQGLSACVDYECSVRSIRD